MRLKKGLQIRGFFTTGAAWMLVLALSLPLANCAKKKPAVTENNDAVTEETPEAAALKKAEGKIKSMQGEIASLQKKVNDGLATEEDKKKLADLEAQLAEVKGTADKATEDLDVANKKIETQTTALAGANTAITSLKKAVALEVTDVKATSYRTLEVEFNHEVDATEAKKAANYTLKGANATHPGAAGIKVSSVNLKASKIVELMTNKRLISMKYTLEVKALKAANPDLEWKDYKNDIIPGGARMLFISDKTTNGNLRKFTDPYDHTTPPLQAAKNLCQAEAEAAKLEGVFDAMVIEPSDASDPIYFAADTHYIRTDALSPTIIGRAKATEANYTYGAVMSLPIDIKADGKPVEYKFGTASETSSSLLTFTGFMSNNNEGKLDSCDNGGASWTVDSGTAGKSPFRSRHASAFLGLDLDSFVDNDSYPSFNSCAFQHRVYCVQTESGAKSKDAAWTTFEDGEDYSGDNYVFVTSKTVTGNIADTVSSLKGAVSGKEGVLAADELCEHLAKTTKYNGRNVAIKKAVTSLNKNSNKYRAIISGEDTVGTRNQIHANERFSTSPLSGTGSYHLLNGIEVMGNMSDMFDPAKGLKAPIAMTEKGAYLAGHNNLDFGIDLSMQSSAVYTGTDLDGESSFAHCNSWTSDSSAYTSLVGDANDAFLSLSSQAKGFTRDAYSCNKPARIYCAYDKDK